MKLSETTRLATTMVQWNLIETGVGYECNVLLALSFCLALVATKKLRSLLRLRGLSP
jgi:hypothetical protein